MKVSWLRGLHFKITLTIIATIVSLSALYFAWDYRLYRQEFLREIEEAANEYSNISLRGIVEVAMLGRQHPQLLQEALENLGSSRSVVWIAVLDESNRVRFSSNRADLGRQFSLQDNGCRNCHSAPELRSRSIFLESAGQQLFRKCMPILNQEKCYPCHDPSKPSNGMLIIDVATTGPRARLQANLNHMFLRAGSMVVVISVLLALLMNRLIISRLRKLSHATTLLARQQEDPNVAVLEQSDDEIGQLAHSFSQMGSQVASSIRELEAQRAHLDNVINSLQDALIVVTPELKVELANRAAGRVCGCAAGLDICAEGPRIPALLPMVRKAFQIGEPFRTEARPADPYRYVEVYCSPVRNREGQITRVIVLFRDITERKMLEKQVNRAERLASVGQLAAGLAHEINNPMAAISTCVEGLDRRVQTSRRIIAVEKEEIKDYLATIGEAASRCTEIIQRLLNISAEPGSTAFQPVDFTQVVRHVVTLVEHEAKKKRVQIHTSLETPATVAGDQQQLSQLLLNLVLNSLDAIDTAGHIDVSVARRSGSIELKVTDSGRGIPEETLERIFDPFFTTKRMGRGTGLGLSICEAIVRHHQGQIQVRSRVGEGTDFTILFPVLQGST